MNSAALGSQTGNNSRPIIVATSCLISHRQVPSGTLRSHYRSTRREIRLTTTPTSTQRLGEHENALFAKWVSARRDKLKRATITDHSAGSSVQSKRATK